VNLVVELDGDSHDMGGRPDMDARRDRWFRERGIRTLRFNAADVMKDCGSAVSQILLVARD
jgi:very-short-patch-repair endonuclease